MGVSDKHPPFEDVSVHNLPELPYRPWTLQRPRGQVAAEMLDLLCVRHGRNHLGRIEPRPPGVSALLALALFGSRVPGLGFALVFKCSKRVT